MPGNPIDVVTGQKITSPWGNQIRDQTVQPFASVAARNAALPAPKNGTVVTVGGILMTYDSGRGWQYVSLFGQSFAGATAAGTIGSIASVTMATFDTPAYERDYWVIFRYRSLFSTSDLVANIEIKLYNPGGGVVGYYHSGHAAGGNAVTVFFDFRALVAAAGGRFTLAVNNLGPTAINNYSDATNNQASFSIVGM